MAIAWNDSFVVGIEDIDRQHQTIVEQFERFSTAVQDGCASELLLEMATFLLGYANEHFATEEGYMRRYDYPRIEEQLGEHAEFNRDAEDMVRSITENGASRELAAAFVGKMVRWVIQHIRNHDRDMALFVKECMDREGTA